MWDVTQDMYLGIIFCQLIFIVFLLVIKDDQELKWSLWKKTHQKAQDSSSTLVLCPYSWVEWWVQKWWWFEPSFDHVIRVKGESHSPNEQDGKKREVPEENIWTADGQYNCSSGKNIQVFNSSHLYNLLNWIKKNTRILYSQYYQNIKLNETCFST